MPKSATKKKFSQFGPKTVEIWAIFILSHRRETETKLPTLKFFWNQYQKLGRQWKLEQNQSRNGRFQQNRCKNLKSNGPFLLIKRLLDRISFLDWFRHFLWFFRHQSWTGSKLLGSNNSEMVHSRRKCYFNDHPKIWPK